MSQAINQPTGGSKKPNVVLRDSSKLQLIHRNNSQASGISTVSNTERHATNPVLPLSHRAGGPSHQQM